MDLVPTAKTSFWQRMGLSEECRQHCIDYVRRAFPGQHVEEFGSQGYCSYTLLVSSQDRASPLMHDGKSKRIVQFRPRQHTIDLSLTDAARKTYGELAPNIRKLKLGLTKDLELDVLEMDTIPGVPYSRLQVKIPVLTAQQMRRQMKLVEQLADFVARAWNVSASCEDENRETGLVEQTADGKDVDRRHERADSPMSIGVPFDLALETSSSRELFLQKCKGKVGVNIVPKLAKLAEELPDETLRRISLETLQGIKEMDESGGVWPVVLNHGDLIPSNILIDPETSVIQGVVDWAEAEWLPFGTCLYALEHFLGYLDYPSSAPPAGPNWRYYDQAPILRSHFHQELIEKAPQFLDRTRRLKVVKDMGILLWYGYAWDDGRIDRVVNEKDDPAEVECLRIFLSPG